MISSKMTLAAALAGAMTLGACTQPMQPGDVDPNQRTKNGALIGAGVGALAGALSKGDGNRTEAAVKGALVGGAIGAGVGYSLDKQEAELRAAMDSRVVITNTGDRLIVSLPNDLTFATDSSAISSLVRSDLRKVAGSFITDTAAAASQPQIRQPRPQV